MANSIIKLKNVSKFYYNKGVIASGFTRVNLEFKMGEFVAITGQSGSGKSTLLNVISGLDSYEEGEMYINGNETSHYIEKDFENYRRRYIGNIYQSFNLVNSYTVYQNIELVMLLNGYKRKEIKTKVNDLIKKVDLYKFRNTKVSKLSGGQKQRVAIARALAKDCPIIIADEPTGNLDKTASESVIKLLSEIAKDKLVIIVTHNYEQVAPYCTRKITMYDGKVLEDKKIKEVEEVTQITESRNKDINIFGKIKLGVRNTYNILPKFLLILAVFLFIVWALMAEYAGFKKLKYNEDIVGLNYVFNDKSPKRIIIKKQDKSVISDEEYEMISSLNNVDYIVKNDIIVDNDISISYKDDWINGKVKRIDTIKSVDKGRMPEKENEIVIEGDQDLYYIQSFNENNTADYTFFDDYSGYADENIKVRIVGVKYSDSWDLTFYMNDNTIEKITNKIYKSLSNPKILFKDKYYYNIVVPSTKVSSGETYIPEEMNYLCKDFDCEKEKPYLNIEVTNKYFKDSMETKVTKTFNNKNFNKLLGLEDYNMYSFAIFVNENDYNKLFDKGNFQSSVYVKDDKNIDEVVNVLKSKGFTTLKMSDALSQDIVSPIIDLLRTGTTIILVIVLFFISYFVIKIILKSRSIYYTTVRMLGGTKDVTKELLVIELLNSANIAYFTFILFVYLGYKRIINVSIINTIIEFLGMNEYITLYIIILFMSLLISLRYSRKIFKSSVIKTLNEEV